MKEPWKNKETEDFWNAVYSQFDKIADEWQISAETNSKYLQVLYALVRLYGEGNTRYWMAENFHKKVKLILKNSKLEEELKICFKLLKAYKLRRKIRRNYSKLVLALSYKEERLADYLQRYIPGKTFKDFQEWIRLVQLLNKHHCCYSCKDIEELENSIKELGYKGREKFEIYWKGEPDEEED